jgi:hypothetical protein
MKRTLLLLFMTVVGLVSVKAQQTYTQGDVTVVVTPNFTHDSFQCNTGGFLNYYITIQNSFSTDSVYIVDATNQQLLSTIGNGMLTTTWSTPYQAPFYNPIIPDDQLQSNMAFFTGPDIKVINGPDTVLIANNFYPHFVPNPCIYGTVSGRVYIDNNNDCSYNTGDQPLNMIPVSSHVTLTNTGMLADGAYTDTGGSYNMTIQESWLSSYTVFIPSAYQFIFPSTTCTPIIYNLNSLPQTGKDFALQCTSNIDIHAVAGSPANVRPTMPFLLYPSVGNTGCDTVSGTLTLVLDPEVTVDLNQTNPTPDYTNGDTLRWNYSTLTNINNGGYWNSFVAGVHLTPDNTLNIGDTVCFRVYADNPTNDVDLTNNDYSFCLPVVNSYDPNMKEVSPKGEGSNGGIPPSTNMLTYTVHFQNTGNAPAFNVSIVDTLDGDIDQSTLKIMGTSHTMSPEWIAPNVVKFNFYNIMLPDSNSNEPESHGYVKFSVRLNSGLTIGTQINNTAYIYFDSNPAIITNTALNTIAWPASVNGTATNSGNINVYPNPVSDNIYIESFGKLNGSAQITDISGKLIQGTELSGNKTKMDVSKLPAGVYLLRINSNDQSVVEKLIKQ